MKIDKELKKMGLIPKKKAGEALGRVGILLSLVFVGIVIGLLL